MTPTQLITLIVTLAGYLIGIACAVHALMTKSRVASSAIAWMFACIALPLIGALLYLTIGQNRMERKRIRHIRMARAAYRARGPREPWGTGRRTLPPETATALGDVVERITGTPPTDGNAFDFFVDGEEAYPAMLAAAEQARSSICAQYYIFDPDEPGKQLRDVLARKAREGVQVRLLYDFVGCLGTHDEFWNPLREAGAKVTSFMPLRLFTRRFKVNLRNHRKLLAIDSEVAFTGSMNIGGRHNCSSGGGRSHDLNFEVRGPAVLRLIEVFASDWYFATGEDLSSLDLFKEPERAGTDLVHVLESGPDEEHGTFHLVLLAAIASARRSLTLVTPYFIPDTSVMDAIVLAARRGLDIKIVVPERPDSLLTRLASRDHLRTVIHAGVQVLERPGPMIHMKVTLVDDQIAIVGTSNLDHRSFFLNFEADLVVHGPAFNTRLREIVAREIAASRRLSAFNDLEDSALKRFAYRLGALFSPIL